MVCTLLKMESPIRRPKYETLLAHSQVRWEHNKGLTLVELLIVIAIVGSLAAVAIPLYTDYIDKARSADAGAMIREIEAKLTNFHAEHGRPPDTLAEAGIVNNIDPWGRPYRYVRIDGVEEPSPPNKWRKDHMTHPVNSDFDLYSAGKDGLSDAPLTADTSQDDVIRANNGTFVGLASDF